MKNDDLKQISKLLDQKLEPVQKELKQHGTLLKQHGTMLRSLKRDQDTILDMLDKEQMSQRKRLTRVEERLGIFSPVS